MKNHLLIDGSGFIFRAYFACPPMKNPQGDAVHAVYGFCRLIRSTLQNWPKDTPVVVAFDTSRISFRNNIYPQYKSHRPAPPEELIHQFALIYEACDAMGILTATAENFEADDVLASYTHNILNDHPDNCVTVITVDKDMMQLVQPRVSLYNPVKKENIDAQYVEEKWGVPPSRVIDVMALTGDASDGVPGVPGIGPKTAASLIKEYGSLEGLLHAAPRMKKSSKQQSIIENTEQARVSYKLVTLSTEAPLTYPVTEMRGVQTDISHWNDFCKAHGFQSLLKAAA